MENAINHIVLIFNSDFFPGCINCYNLPHGHVKFSGLLTPYYSGALAICDDGYQITGPLYLSCLANATWSTGPSCVLKGAYIDVSF